LTVPGFIKPQLAQVVREAPEGDDWLHEIKLDGYRMHAQLDGGRVQILTRRANDWTAKYPTIAEAVAALSAQNASLVVYLGEREDKPARQVVRERASRDRIVRFQFGVVGEPRLA
jgi:ATP-dependent DNA ligase